MLDFIAGCLVLDPEQRYTAAEALKHPFITGVEVSKKLRQKYSSSIDQEQDSPSKEKYYVGGRSPAKKERLQVPELQEIMVSEPMIINRPTVVQDNI